MAALFPPAKFQAFNSDGTPMVDGSLYAYVANSSTPQDTYTDSTEGTANANPVVLDSRGEADVWLGTGALYKLVLKDADGVTVWTVDQIGGGVNAATLAASGGSALIGFIQSGAGAAATTVQAKLRESVSVKDFGGAVGDGVTDDQAAVQASIDYIETLTFGGEVWFPAGVYKINSGLTLNVNKTSLIGGGVKLDFSSLGISTTAITFNSSEADGNLAALYASTKCMEGFFLLGPGVSQTGVKCFDFTDASQQVANYSINRCAFTGWETQARVYTNAFCLSFNNCAWIKTSAANDIATCVSVPSGGSNYGERITFNQCQFANLQRVLDVDISASVFFNDCSLDYCDVFIDATAGALVYVKGGHIESDDDTDYWFKCDATNTLISLNNLQIGVTGNKSSKQIGNLTNSPTNGGIEFNNVNLSFGANTYSLTEVISGTGRVVANNLMYANASAKPIVSNNANAFPFGGTFEDSNSLSALTLSGTTPPTRSNTYANTDTWSLYFDGNAGEQPKMLYRTPINVGQIALIEFWSKTLNFSGTSATFYGVASYTDSNGNQVAGGATVSVTTDVDWTRRSLTFSLPAPIGATHIQFSIEIFGIASGNPDAWVDDVVLNIA